jgi:hypothetical protein
MQVGTLHVEVKHDGKRPQLVIQGGLPLALATDVTVEDLLRLARYVEAQAVKLRDEREGKTW